MPPAAAAPSQEAFVLGPSLPIRNEGWRRDTGTRPGPLDFASTQESGLADLTPPAGRRLTWGLRPQPPVELPPTARGIAIARREGGYNAAQASNQTIPHRTKNVPLRGEQRPPSVLTLTAARGLPCRTALRTARSSRPSRSGPEHLENVLQRPRRVLERGGLLAQDPAHETSGEIELVQHELVGNDQRPSRRSVTESELLGFLGQRIELIWNVRALFFGLSFASARCADWACSAASGEGSFEGRSSSRAARSRTVFGRRGRAGPLR